MTQQELKKILEYDKDTGIFTWKVRKAYRTKIGSVAGTLYKGYSYILISRKRYSAARLAWLYVYGEFPKNNIDHINQNKSDNRISNLRDVTNSENMKNRPMMSSNFSGIVGVSWSKTREKWHAQIRNSGKVINLGLFDNVGDAKRAREEAKIKYDFHSNHA